MSRKIYALSQFKAKAGRDNELFEVLKALEPNTLREEGCLQYIVTRHIHSPFAEGESFPIVLQAIWENKSAFESHCARKEIVHFFEKECKSGQGLAEAYHVCIYTDEPVSYDAPQELL